MSTGKKPLPPEQCRLCVNFDDEEMICKNYDFLPGEGDRKDITDCPSAISREESESEDLRVLAEYIKEDAGGVVESRITEAVDNILSGYDNKFRIMVVGIARRKISAMVKMVDIIDVLLRKLTDINDDTVQNMTPGQTIKLLQELNHSVNNDLSFIMTLIKPDSDLKVLQTYIDNRTLNVNGSSMDTEIKADEILSMTGTSRDKIREAFDAILHNIDVPGIEDVHTPTEAEKEDLDII